VLTQLFFTILARIAAATVNVGIYRDVISHGKTGHTGAYFYHLSGILMAQHHGWTNISGTRFPVIDVDVCTADAADFIAQHQFPRASMRLGQLCDFKGLVPQKTSSFHNELLPVYNVDLLPFTYTKTVILSRTKTKKEGFDPLLFLQDEQLIS
jgi:hypothetical protein